MLKSTKNTKSEAKPKKTENKVSCNSVVDNGEITNQKALLKKN